jgi:GNAT superfamily N-acetyltransferase
MNIEIKKLTPELVEDYLHFFDVTPHDDGIDEHKCYCVCWCSADHRNSTDFSTAQKRRELARQYVNSGMIQGYLAYQDGKAVGWCNANVKSACLNCLAWVRFMQAFGNEEPALKIKSVFCFTIAPEMQRTGIATKLLDRVCADAKRDGFDIVESYPNADFVNTENDFMGPSTMYKNSGFSVFKTINKKIIMRKELK